MHESQFLTNVHVNEMSKTACDIVEMCKITMLLELFKILSSLFTLRQVQDVETFCILINSLFETVDLS